MVRPAAVALAYAAATVYGSWVAVLHDLRSEPFGRDVIPLPASRTVAVGLGGGTAIPAVMSAVAVLAAFRSERDPRWARVCVGIGSTSVVGTLVEAATWGRRAPGPDIGASVVLNLGVSVALVAHGLGSRSRTLRTAAGRGA
ncbi:hypothetical protein [Cellulosimicrobium sp. CUA-896]|uniref:hypothetical protein n=1 Tax=Cellulosimicrobium sp. CUA-896 TaxID=1517881 RepID=UPI000960993F|nr:hypothetical protein [Cellulosimicrobium sp. CUA-896]OLT53230.1 hypothetical protein BJF88_12770 [Cellulosimicrobium sp. CUA-896]